MLGLILNSGYNDDKQFANEADYSRATFDKGTNEIREIEDPKDLPEGDIFEVVEAGSGEEFMAVKPWIGAVVEPTDRKLSPNFILNSLQTILPIPLLPVYLTHWTMSMGIDARIADKMYSLTRKETLCT